VALVTVAFLALVACGGGGGGGGGGGAGDRPAAGPITSVEGGAPIPEPIGVEAGKDGWVNVAVANLWAEPDQTRPLDAPSLGKVVDIDAWLAAMTVDDRLWLVGRLVTQALYGDQVTVVESAGAWTRVVVRRQSSSLDPGGYPGWLPTVQVTSVAPLRPGATDRGDAIVTRPTAPLRDSSDPGRKKMELSFNTRLPILSADQIGVAVGIPGGGDGLLSTGDFEILAADAPPPTGEQVVRTAELFSGVDYLWGGTSGPAWDCSGLTSAVYAVHGIAIPRDAHDQAAVGAPVDRGDLRPGDLLFYATGASRESIHHVAMYVGDGRMIQAPATGRVVETVSIDDPARGGQYWGARRYLPQPSG